MDLFSRKAVGYACADHMRAELCVEALVYQTPEDSERNHTRTTTRKAG